MYFMEQNKQTKSVLHNYDSSLLKSKQDIWNYHCYMF